MKLTESNYFSEEADREYLSCSQFKNFVGTLGKKPCEAHAIAVLNGEWKDETTTALLVGSYVDAHFEGTLDLFKAQHPEMFKKDGSPKAEYVKADIMINRCERDEKFMQYMDGYKQVIMTADMFGSKWKIKIDSYHPGTAIVDLKTCESVTKQFYSKDLGYMNFIEYWGYLYQGAIYREVEYFNQLSKCRTEEERAKCKRLPFYIAAVSKEKEPDICIIQVPSERLDEALEEVKNATPNIVALKNGEFDPMRCEGCDYCKHTKVLDGPIMMDQILGEI